MNTTKIIAQALVALLFTLCLPTSSFQSLSFLQRHPSWSELRMAGFGVAEDYTWKEDALEIEITVQLPSGITGKDVHFKPGLTSIDLRVDRPDGEQVVLLDGGRKLRGRISLDGTFWVFSDRRRSITVTAEKYFAHSNDDMQVLDYEWKGVYPQDEEEVSQRKYDEPEKLNVREYAASLGVDVDNINTSMVDKNMFTSGLNLTQRTVDQLTEKGLVSEVTQQNDGEYITNPETGEKEPFNFDTTKGETDPTRINIPFLDTNSPWHQAVSVNVDRETNKTTVADMDELKKSLKENAKTQAKKMSEAEEEGGEEESGGATTTSVVDPKKPSDPIERLTVKKLQDILRKQGLKVSGSKQELQDRIRGHVNSMLQTPTKDVDESP